MRLKFILSIGFLTIILSCKKDGVEKKCYLCTTYNEEIFRDGSISKDTVLLPICQTDEWVLEYIKTGTYDGESWSKESGKDTVFFYLKAKTECKLK